MLSDIPRDGTFTEEMKKDDSGPDRRLSVRGQRSMQGESVDSSQPREWKDVGIQMVRTSDLPDDPQGIQSEADFEKVSMAEMQQGLTRLESMKPYIKSGEGANSDFWREFDQKQGFAYKDGYQRVYEAFYGDTAIKASRNGGVYDVENGRHRIWLAKRMGIEELPVKLKVREET